jgi:hypothetical protein
MPLLRVGVFNAGPARARTEVSAAQNLMRVITEQQQLYFEGK